LFKVCFRLCPTVAHKEGRRVERAIAARNEDLVELVDEAGRVIGQAARTTVHHRETPRHRAFSVYLTDAADRVLLTRRALSKVTWPGVWSNSCCGHPRPGETDLAAIQRRVREELGVDVINIEVLLPDFGYTAADPRGLVENEHCPVYRAAIVDRAVLRPDPNEVMDYHWLTWPDLIETVERAPGLLSPWSVSQVRALVSSRALVASQNGAWMRRRPNDPQTTDVGVTQAAVTRLLTEQIDELASLWHELGGGQTLHVLVQDLPAWLGTVLVGGKRLRPAMCHWGYVAAGADIDGPGHPEMVKAATALELLHQFALLHDDVMDDSDIRRGGLSAHRQAERWHADAGGFGDGVAFGRNLAVLLGDLALVQAHRLVASLAPGLRELWYELCVELVLGQRGDLTGAAAGRHDRSHAVRLAQLKSGAYTVARPLGLGAAAARGTAAVRRALNRYGLHAGMAFALRDEVLGVWGDPAVTGKPAGDDLRTGKPTVLLSLAVDRLSGAAAEALHKTGSASMTSRDVSVLQDALSIAGVRDEMEKLILKHVEDACNALTDHALHPAGVAGLIDLTNALAWRTS
jgi:geranylgeranyl diphosphate synthase, type I